nr:MAG TPA: hypothetical protein [Bacteriophage sp.]
MRILLFSPRMHCGCTNRCSSVVCQYRSHYPKRLPDKPL